jgi:hypothetical protein
VLVLGNEFEEHSLVHSGLIKTQGKENQMKLLVLAMCGLLEAVKCLK